MDNAPIRHLSRETTMSDAAIKAEIKKLEDRRYQAMIDSDFDTLDRLLGDQLVYTHSTSQSDTRAEYIALCKKGVFKYRKIERPVENIQVYGDDTVVVTGQIKIDAVIEGKPKQLNSRYTDLWRKGPKGWQMVAWQSTPIPA
jgi:ketosteroid isomerase-like protein